MGEVFSAIAVEVKRARRSDGSDLHDPAELAAHAHDVALRQALDKCYGADLLGAGRSVWGVSFSGKQVAVAMERVQA